MKYSDGFFIFQTENSGSNFSPVSPNVKETWIKDQTIEGYERYTYYWLIYSQDGYRQEFHEAPVWVNSGRKLIVIFLSDYKLISEVINGASRRFGVGFIPYSLASRAMIMGDGNLITTNKGVSNTLNKVKTTLLKNDHQRLSVIESVLVGE